jgi:hypothetical protein
MLAPAPAAADSRVQASIAATAGATDNAFDAASDGSTAEPRADGFAGVDPQLLFITDTRRLTSIVSAGASLRQYLNESQGNRRSVTGGWSVVYLAAPTWRVGGNAALTYADVAAFDPTDVGTAVPAGGGTFVTVAGSGTVAKDFSQSLRAVETFGVNAYLPQDDSPLQTRGVGLHEGLEVQLSSKRDAFGFALSTDVYRYDPPSLPTVTNVSVTLGSEWFHELSAFWGVLAGAGVAMTFAEDTSPVTPVGRIGFRYHGDLSNAELRLAETVSSNPRLGATFTSSEASVRADVRLGRFFALGVVGSGARSSAIDADSIIYLVNGELRASWLPRDNLSVDLSYALLHQANESGTLAAPDLSRNTVTLSVRWSYPDHRPTPRVIDVGGLGVRQSEDVDVEEAERAPQ